MPSCTTAISVHMTAISVDMVASFHVSHLASAQLLQVRLFVDP
ncbi:MAG: hypothetical protein ACR2M5_07155 [Nakamurella sp.]